MRRDRRWIVIAPLAAVLLLPACRDLASEESGGYEPATVEPIKGTEFSRVTLTADGARRIGLETTHVVDAGGATVVAESAVWIDEHGDQWVYAVTEPLVYVRKAIVVDRFENGEALLSKGPAAGTEVVSVGVAELIGSEFGV
jgi:hypothetical protein